jgi:biotin carboxyl carrier protein
LTFDLELGGRSHALDVRREGERWLVTLDGRQLSATVESVGGRWSLLIAAADGEPGDGARSFEVAIEARSGSELLVHVDGHTAAVASAGARGRRRPSPRGGGGAAGSAGPDAIVSPMPGRIVKVLVKPGDLVEPRQGLVVVEAMKMENEVRAAGPGTVTDVRVTEGMSVEAGAVLVVVG